MVVLKELDCFDENLGLRIKISREKAGLTQEQLAERINKSLSFVSMLEQGRCGAKVSTLRDICFAVDASADYILLGIDPDKEDIIIAQKLRVLNYHDKIALLHLLNSLTEGTLNKNNPDEHK